MTTKPIGFQLRLTLDHPSAKEGMPVFVDGLSAIDPAIAIKVLRRSCALSTTDFGALIGVSGRTINGWEQGRPVNKAAIWQIKNVFGRRGLLGPVKTG